MRQSGIEKCGGSASIGSENHLRSEVEQGHRPASISFHPALCENVPPGMRESERPQPALGKAIRQLRERRRMTQEVLGRKASLTGRSLSAIETGRANPTWATVSDIASALDVPVSTLAKASERLEG